MMYRRWKDLVQGVLVSDASGGWGCGAFFQDSWFQLEWAGNLEGSHITIKELVPITIAAAVWGPKWLGQNIEVKCDNAAVVAIINLGSCKDPEVMHLMRCLMFFMAKFQFSMYATHIAGSENSLADALSRDRLAYNWLLCYYELEIIGVMGRSVSRGYEFRLGWFGLKFSNLSRVVAQA